MSTSDVRDTGTKYGGALIPKRAAAATLAAGAVLFAVGSLTHPPTVRREDLMHVVLEGATSKWIAEHWLLALAAVLMTVGLAGFHAALSALPGIRRGTASLAAPLGAVSAAFWIGLFVFEAAGWPVIAAALSKGAGPASPLLPVAQALWNTSLALGYAGGVLFAAAVGLWSAALMLDGGQEGLKGFAWLGMVAATVGIVTQALAWIVPALALYALIPAAGLLGLWLLLVVRRLWRRSI